MNDKPAAALAGTHTDTHSYNWESVENAEENSTDIVDPWAGSHKDSYSYKDCTAYNSPNDPDDSLLRADRTETVCDDNTDLHDPDIRNKGIFFAKSPDVDNHAQHVSPFITHKLIWYKVCRAVTRRANIEANSLLQETYIRENALPISQKLLD